MNEGAINQLATDLFSRTIQIDPLLFSDWLAMLLWVIHNSCPHNKADMPDCAFQHRCPIHFLLEEKQ